MALCTSECRGRRSIASEPPPLARGRTGFHVTGTHRWLLLEVGVGVFGRSLWQRSHDCGWKSSWHGSGSCWRIPQLQAQLQEQHTVCLTTNSTTDAVCALGPDAAARAWAVTRCHSSQPTRCVLRRDRNSELAEDWQRLELGKPLG